MKQQGNDVIDPRVSALLENFLGSMDDSGQPYKNWLWEKKSGYCSERRFPLSDSEEVLKCELHLTTMASLAICRLSIYKALEDWWQAGSRDPNISNSDERTRLLLAAITGRVDIVIRLTIAGADMFAEDKQGYNALEWACYTGRELVVRLLLDCGIDVNRPSGIYGNAIQNASAQGHVTIVQLLLDQGADVDTRGSLYGDALGAAAYYSHESVVQLLLNREADFNAHRGWYGYALHKAAAGGNKPVMRLLLDHGANVNV